MFFDVRINFSSIQQSWLFKLFFVLFLSIQPCLYCAQYKLALCSMFKNEAPWIREWIEYHRLLGVEHFYLFENESTDNTVEVLRPYIDQGLVEVIPWTNTPAHRDPRSPHFDAYQIKAFNNCIRYVKRNVQWLAIVDADEYIVPIQGRDALHALLDREANTDTGSLLFYWVIYGTSNVWKIPENKLMTEMLMLRADDNHPWHVLMKSIHKPKAVAECLVHEARLHKGYKQKWLHPSEFRINHYWTRNTQELLSKRFKLHLESQPDDLTFFLQKEGHQHILDLLNAFNRVEDPAIAPYLPELRKVMFNN